MIEDHRVDPEIMNAITDELKDRDLDGVPYANKLKRRVINKLIGKFHESDLLDLIEDMPDLVWDKER